jgi:hypothetical protein
MSQPTPPADAGKRAREQADAYDSVFASTPLELNDGTTIDIPPHPNLAMLDDDRQAAYEELIFEVESYDREEDIFIPEQHLTSGAIVPAGMRRGNVITPHRKDGQLIKPPYSQRMVTAVLGEDVYARMRAGGKSAGDVMKIWQLQGLALADRQQIDSKSNGSASVVENVSG